MVASDLINSAESRRITAEIWDITENIGDIKRQVVES